MLALINEVISCKGWTLYAEAYFCICKKFQLNRHVVTFKGRFRDGRMKKKEKQKAESSHLSQKSTVGVST